MTRTPAGRSPNRARKIRDHDRLVDLSDERGQRARELGRMAVRDDDCGDLHVSSISRYTASVRSAAERQLKARARSSPAATSRSRSASAALDPVGQLGLLDEDRGASRHFAQGRIRHGDHRGSGCHGLEDGEPEALVPTRLDETCGSAIELDEPIRPDVALEPGATPHAAHPRAPGLSPARRRRGGGSLLARPPEPRAGSSVAGSLRPTGRSRASPIPERRSDPRHSASRRSAAPECRTAPRCPPSFAPTP